MANPPPLAVLVEVHDRLQAQYERRDYDAMRDLLRDLHRTRPRMKDLAASQLGRLLSQLARDDVLPPQVKVHVEVLLAQWKRFAVEEGIRPPRRDEGDKENAAPNPKRTSHKAAKAQGGHPHRPQPYPPPRAAAAAAAHHPAAPPGPASPGLQFQLYDEPGRNVIVRRLVEVLSLPLPAGASAPSLEPLEAAKDIEDELHATFSQEHDPENKLLRFGQLRSNLRDNGDLRAAVLCRETPARKLVHMKAWELGKWEARQHAQMEAKNGAIKSEW
eukprot:EG_transcript_13786